MSDLTTPAVLIIRDGWGRNPNADHDKFNAVKLANTPFCDQLLETWPWTLIKTSSEDVGLPDGTMGNSEVGHQNIGAGRVVDQESVRITKAVRTGEFFDNHILADAVRKARETDRTVHLIGIASDAGVHGLMEHLYACLELCRRNDVDRVALHVLTDGRDTPPFSGIEFIKQIEAKCGEIGVGKVASVIGRYYAMDRDNRWERVARAYACLTGRDADDVNLAASATEAIQSYYEHPTNQSQKGDEFITPTMIGDSRDAALQTRIADGDTVVFYNYRGDRPREITKAFVFDDSQWTNVSASPDSGKRGFARGERIDLTYVTMTAYEQGLPVNVAFPKPPKMENIFGAYLASKHLRQFRTAETEKFPHVTFFFNDYREEPFEGEGRQMAQSPKVATYDLQPEMSAAEVCDIVMQRLNSDNCEDVIVVNFANGDMVGHTGVLEAAIKACETVDGCVRQIIDKVLELKGIAIVTADHGNAEQMYIPEVDSAHTAHTLYDVECILVDPRKQDLASGGPDTASTGLRDDGRLADIVPTLLAMMGLQQPTEMTGASLLRD